MLLRPANPDDIPAMAAIASRAVESAQWTEDHYQSIFRPGAARRIALVLENQGTVAGFIIARPLGPEWELENIAVAESARRTGLASSLLDELFNIARRENAQSIFLEVRESNLPARNFYEKSGFLESGRRPSYYPNPPEDAITYTFTFPK